MRVRLKRKLALVNWKYVCNSLFESHVLSRPTIYADLWINYNQADFLGEVFYEIESRLRWPSILYHWIDCRELIFANEE